MSTDVYIDFHAPGMFELYEKDWQEWARKVNEGTTPRHNLYNPERIAYLYNFQIGSNYQAWLDFEEKFRTKVVTNELIEEIVEAYRPIYDYSQNPDVDADSNLFCREDIATPEDLRNSLMEHIGFTIDLRVD